MAAKRALGALGGLWFGRGGTPVSSHCWVSRLTGGLLGAFARARFLAGMLYEIRPTDAATFLVVSLAMTGVALLASYIPAHRATKVHPVVALRYE